MIRTCTQSDHELIYDYLKAEAALNLFLLGDLEVYGYDKDFQDLWADLDDAGRVLGVLLRYHHTYILYTKGDCDLPGFGEIVRRDPELEMIQGKQELVNRFLDATGLDMDNSRPYFFAEMKNGAKLDPNADTSAVQKATLADIDRIVALHAAIDEFPPRKDARESLERTMKNNFGRTYFMEENGEMAAAASTTAENSLSAMVVGVCTHPDHRQKGLASLCLQSLCRDLLSEGRTLCLFYDNPKAGSIYKRLGFEDIGIWAMCRVNA